MAEFSTVQYSTVPVLGMPYVVRVAHEGSVPVSSLDRLLHLARLPGLLAFNSCRFVRRNLGIPREVAILLVAQIQLFQQLKDITNLTLRCIDGFAYDVMNTASRFRFRSEMGVMTRS